MYAYAKMKCFFNFQSILSVFEVGKSKVIPLKNNLKGQISVLLVYEKNLCVGVCVLFVYCTITMSIVFISILHIPRKVTIDRKNK